MILTRRDLLRSLLAAPVAPLVDWEQLLWVPGQLVAVPSRLHRATLDEIVLLSLRQILPGVTRDFFQPSPLLAYLRDHGPSVAGGTPLPLLAPPPAECP